ncbi:histidine phosphatase family protein [Paenibacillus sp. P96]|uniref:Histidine phosphatase family protein n=1 Tax=Paenibacillus zeirhizosphaerae TaxID=2987519 RepID=A0ABT9FLQ0_9BACL|nr:histidine phosphatase family protein [Paenibacillus sp. P96]MDP4095307.1 histidine phosphatase family protein [Paenibacillus sp. P96]
MSSTSHELDLILVRHGTTSWNRDKRYVGHANPGLLPGAEDELRPLSHGLRKRRFARVYSSDLRRCTETLRLAAPELAAAAVMDARLRELDFGAWDGETYESLKHLQMYRSWIDDPRCVTPPGGERLEHFEGRLVGFLNSLQEGGLAQEGSGVEDIPAVLAVTHGGVIRQLAVLTVPGVGFWSIHVPPAGVAGLRLCYQEGRITGSWLGDV